MKQKLITLTPLILLLFTLSTQTTNAWFGAGSTPGWPHTTTGLRGEIALPHYKFSPDFYWVEDTVSVATTAFNSTSTNVVSDYYFVISQVLESPIGENVTDGDPDNPGLNENQLYNNQKSSNDLQSIVSVRDLGEITIPAVNSAGVPGQAVISASFTTTTTGYYQFDFMDIDPRVNYEPGHILTAGFFRVLQGEITPAPSPSPSISPTLSPSPTPTPTPTPTPEPSSTPTPQDNNDSEQGGAQVVTEIEQEGQVLGDSTSILGATGSISQLAGYSLTFLVGFAGYLTLTRAKHSS